MAFITVSGPVGFVLKHGSPGSIVGAAAKPVREKKAVADNGGETEIFLSSHQPFPNKVFYFFFQCTCSYIKDIVGINSSTDLQLTTI